MIFRTPAFWYKKPGLISGLLSPLAGLYLAGHRLNQPKAPPKTVSIPVICIGNVTAGGTGKTPASLALYQLLTNKNLFFSPFFLTRGYGGIIKGPERVNPNGPASMWGDETLLLADTASTIISANRYDGAKLAKSLGADLIIMDDGFQNKTLQKTLTFLTINGKQGFGNGKLLPAGPLREPIEDALQKADAFILVGDDESGVRDRLPQNKPVFKAFIKPLEGSEIEPDRTYYGFCGIAHPDRFKKTLEDNGYKLSGFKAFPDHYDYSNRDLDKLLKRADKNNAILITTEKDMMRIDTPAMREQITYLPVHMAFEQPAALIDYIASHT